MTTLMLNDQSILLKISPFKATKQKLRLHLFKVNIIELSDLMQTERELGDPA